MSMATKATAKRAIKQVIKSNRESRRAETSIVSAYYPTSEPLPPNVSPANAKSNASAHSRIRHGQSSASLCLVSSSQPLIPKHSTYDTSFASTSTTPYPPPQPSTSRLPPHSIPLSSFTFDSTKRSYVFSSGASGSAKHGHSPSGGSGSARTLHGATGAAGETETGHRKTRQSEGDETLSVQVGEDAYFLRSVRSCAVLFVRFALNRVCTGFSGRR